MSRENDLGTMTIWSDRWRLGALSRVELMNIGMVSALVGCLFVLFHLLGNRVENVNSSSAFSWMVARWNDKESFGADYSHGYLIPVVSLWVVWYKREALFAARKQVCQLGLAVIVMALMMHWVGAKMQQTRISLVSLILLLWGIPFYFYGWEVAKHLIFPCSYLFFCVPLNFLDSLSFPLQQVATEVSYNILVGVGLDVQRVGTMLTSPYFQLNVDAPCSGLRSMLAMTALAAVYAYYNQRGLIKKWILFVLSVPLAVLGNIARVLSIAFVSKCLGQEVGAGLWHDWAGYFSFSVVSISLLIWASSLLNKNYREAFRSWKEAYLSRSSA
jgi:exosortase